MLGRIGIVPVMLLQLWCCFIAATASAAKPPREPYREEIAKSFLTFSTISYCDQPIVANWSCDLCPHGGDALTNVTVVNQATGITKLRAYVGARPSDGAVIVAFRGTVDQDIMNWIKDVGIVETAPWKDLKGVKVHGGFYSSWGTLRDGVFGAVAQLAAASGVAEAGPVAVHITGHSLGASMAALAAFELTRSASLSARAVVGHVYTFGQPRTGNAAFAAAYNASIGTHWRLTHNRDPVPQFPWPALGYHHVPQEVFYDEHSTKYVICDGSGEDPNCQNKNGIANLVPKDHTTYLNTTTGSGSCH